MDTLNIVFLILALLGVVATLITYWKSIVKKKPTYDKINYNLINESITTLEKLEVKYNENEIKNFSTGTISFYNSGKGVIRKEDIAPLDKLRIELSDEYEILNAEIIFESNKVNNCSILMENNKNLIISFDFLDENQGLVVKFYHTGKNIADFNIKGTIIGANKMIHIDQRYTQNKMLRLIDKSRKIPVFSALIIPFLMLFAIVIAILERIFEKSPKNEYMLS